MDDQLKGIHQRVLYKELWEKAPTPSALLGTKMDEGKQINAFDLLAFNTAFKEMMGLSCGHLARDEFKIIFSEWLRQESIVNHAFTLIPPGMTLSSNAEFVSPVMGCGDHADTYLVRLSSVCDGILIVSFEKMRNGRSTSLSNKKSTPCDILNAIQCGVLTTNDRGRILSCNRAAGALFGVGPSKLIGLHYSLLIHPMDRYDALEHMRMLTQSQGEHVSEKRLYLRADGTSFPGHVVGRRMNNPDGSFRAFVILVADLGDRETPQHFFSKLVTRHKTVINTIPDMVIFKNSQGLFLTFNTSFEEFWGLKESYLIGRTDFDLMPLELALKIQKTDHEAARKGKTLVVEERLPSKHTGRSGLFEVLKTPLYDPNGGFMGVLCVYRDITQRLCAENKLKASEARYRELFENLTIGVAVIKIHEELHDFEICEFNRAAEKITGKKKDDVVGCHGYSIFPGLSPSSIIVMSCLDVWHTGQSVYLPHLVYEDEALKFWMSANIYRLPMGQIGLVFNDITGEKRIEQELRVNHGILTSVINSIGDSLFIINRDYEIEFQNELSREYFGGLTTQKCYAFLFGKKSPCPHCRMPDVLSKCRLARAEADIPHQKQFEITFSPFKNEAGGSTKVVVLLRDVTEKKQFQAEALRAGQLACIGELAAGVAHEINNPVTGIISIAEILADQYEAMGKDRSIPDRIVSEGERISAIVKNLLSFARLKPDSLAAVDIGTIIKSTLQLIEKWFEKDEIQLVLELPFDLPPIWGNEQEIRQVFLNILSNSRYALNQKGAGRWDKQIKIIARVRKTPPRIFVRISFEDNGIGICPDLIGMITDPFFTTKPRGEGTGLGLSISYGLIQKHKGHFYVESKEGRGTTIHVDLPCAPSGDSPDKSDNV